MASGKATRLLCGLSIAFSLLSLLYIGRGLHQLLSEVSTSEAKDLMTNWNELQLVLSGKNPYENTLAPSPYPPFTFPANLLFLWPAWPSVRLYWAALNLICLGFLSTWAYRRVAWRGASFGTALALSIPAASAVSTGLGLGQNAILYTAMLVLALQMHQRGKGVRSGVLMGVAMSKISLALPFLLPALFQKNWRILLGAGGYMIGATILVCLWLSAWPLHLVELWVEGAERFGCVDYGPATFICHMGVPPKIANRVCELIVLAVAGVTFLRLRRLALVTLYGLAAGFGRLWTYHRVYDNFVLIILLVALADAYVRTERRELGVALAALGVTLWLPPKLSDFELVQLAHLIIWTAAMSTLAIWAPRSLEVAAKGQCAPH